MSISRRWVQQIKVNEDTLALDLIEHVGPRGHFLDADHTVEHLHAGELIHPELFERLGRESWLAKGAKNLVNAAR
jgi:trimethylamine--corrinoid protein Co-methyltransferase